MAEFKKLINPPIKVSEINSESATSGQVLQADGAGGASWQDNSVNANPTLDGGEAQLTAIEIGGTKYKVNTFTVTENADGTVDLTIE